LDTRDDDCFEVWMLLQIVGFSGDHDHVGWVACSYWSSHTSSIPSILEGTIASLISLFDIATGTTQLPFASGTTLVQGLTNTRPDAYGALMRQGSAALINSYHFSNFAYTPQQVRESFNGALYSEQAAAVQAVQFENANRGYDVRNMAP
jgi:hypothetical protein